MRNDAARRGIVEHARDKNMTIRRPSIERTTPMGEELMSDFYASPKFVSASCVDQSKDVTQMQLHCALRDTQLGGNLFGCATKAHTLQDLIFDGRRCARSSLSWWRSL